jgi:hypothetical protein
MCLCVVVLPNVWQVCKCDDAAQAINSGSSMAMRERKGAPVSFLGQGDKYGA